MLLTIHNLPIRTQYNDIKELIVSKCGLKEIILDNLKNEGNGVQVTVGVMEEEDAAILVRKINGLYFRGQQLYVQDKRQKKSIEQPYRTPAGQQAQYMQQAMSEMNYDTQFQGMYQPTNYSMITPGATYLTSDQNIQNAYVAFGGVQAPQQPLLAYSELIGGYQQPQAYNQDQAAPDNHQPPQKRMRWEQGQDARQASPPRPNRSFQEYEPRQHGGNEKRDSRDRSSGYDDSQDMYDRRSDHFEEDPRAGPRQDGGRSSRGGLSQRGGYTSRGSHVPRGGHSPRGHDGSRHNPSSRSEPRGKFDSDQHGYRGHGTNERASRDEFVWSGLGGNEPYSHGGSDKNEYASRGGPGYNSGRGSNEHGSRDGLGSHEPAPRGNNFSGPTQAHNSRGAYDNSRDDRYRNTATYKRRWVEPAADERRPQGEWDESLMTERPSRSRFRDSGPQSAPPPKKPRDFIAQNATPQINQRKFVAQNAAPPKNQRDFVAQNAASSRNQRTFVAPNAAPPKNQRDFVAPNAAAPKNQRDFVAPNAAPPKKPSDKYPDPDTISNSKLYQMNLLRSAGKLMFEVGTHLGIASIFGTGPNPLKKALRTSLNNRIISVTNMGERLTMEQMIDRYRKAYPRHTDGALHAELKRIIAAGLMVKQDQFQKSIGGRTPNPINKKKVPAPGASAAPKNVKKESSWNPAPVIPGKISGHEQGAPGVPTASKKVKKSSWNPPPVMPGKIPSHVQGVPAPGASAAPKNVKKESSWNPAPVIPGKISGHEQGAPGVPTASKKVKKSSWNPPPVMPGKIPSHVQGDKKLHKQIKRQHLADMESLAQYELDETFHKVLNEEVAVLTDIMVKEFKTPIDPQEKRVFGNNADQMECIEQCKKFVLHHMSKRLSDSDMKLVRVYGHPKAPCRTDLEHYLLQHDCISLKKAHKGPFYLASFKSYQKVDELAQKEVKMPSGIVVTFKPLHFAMPKPKIGRKNIREIRRRYTESLIEDSTVNLLDKDWPKQMEEEDKIKSDKMKGLESDDVIFVSDNVIKATVDITGEDDVATKPKVNVQAKADNNQQFMPGDFKVIDEVNESDCDDVNKELSKEPGNVIADDWDVNNDDWEDMGDGNEENIKDENSAGGDGNVDEDDNGDDGNDNNGEEVGSAVNDDDEHFDCEAGDVAGADFDVDDIDMEDLNDEDLEDY